MSFVRVGKKIVARDAITEVDTTRIEQLEVTVRGPALSETVRDADGDRGERGCPPFLRLAPSLLEGPRLRFARNAWAMHNLIGHPLLQLFAWLGQVRVGLFIHDATVPHPRR